MEIESFKRHGQIVPALGRPLHGDLAHDVELIYGARRLFVARHLNCPLKVELREKMTDRDAIIAMDIENRQRTDISAYERGMSYARWLRGGHFKSQEELARALKVSPSQVSRLLKIARLPTVVVAAFERAVDICEGWGLDLIEALEDPERKQATLHKARALGNVTPRPTPREVYRQLLLASLPGRKIRIGAHDEVVKDQIGRPLFRIRHQSNAISLVLPMKKVSAQALQEIRRSVTSILQGESGQLSNVMKMVPERESAAPGVSAQSEPSRMQG